MRIESIPANAPAKMTSPSLGQVVKDDNMPIAAESTTSITVAISGQTLLRQRIFHGAPDVEPPFLDIKKAGTVLKPELYLNPEDRSLLGAMYELAQSEGMHLAYVDHLGRELAEYRGNDNGQYRLPHNRGGMFDLQGHLLSYSFTDADSQAAQRVRENVSLSTTRLDQGFIQFQTDKDYSALSHCDFDFLDLMISRFSDVAGESGINGRFQTHQYVERNYIEHVSSRVYATPFTTQTKKAPDTTHVPKHQSAESVTPVDLSTTLRGIVRQYLQKTGLPTLFETLMRQGR